MEKTCPFKYAAVKDAKIIHPMIVCNREGCELWIEKGQRCALAYLAIVDGGKQLDIGKD